MLVDTYTYSDKPEDVAIYEKIKSWSPDTFPQPGLLPKLGVIVWDEERTDIICFVCVDMSNSIPRAMIDFLQTNPAYGPTKRHKAVIMAEDFLCERLKAHGYVLIIGLTIHAGVASLSQDMGYHVVSKPVIEFTKTLN